MINNFKQISELLKFETEDDFYFCQILKRKKEHSELGRNSVVVATYYIKNIEDFWRYSSEIILLCDFHNARAYINLNKRSFEKVAFHNLKKVTDCILNKDYDAVRKAYDSTCGSSSNEEEKKWVLDVDRVPEGMQVPVFIDDVKRGIDNCMPKKEGTKLISVVSSKNGFHIICTPFNIQQFIAENVGLYPYLDIHKDNPTNLYIPND